MGSSARAAVVVANFTQSKLETHVEKALQKAWLLSGGRPLNASQLLKAALLVGRTDRSEAFVKLASLLRLSDLSDVKTTELPPANLAALPLTRPLADSFLIAEPFFKDQGALWGRDYVTLALLAKDDPSLAEMIRDAGSSSVAVLDDWYFFVSSSSKRRTADAWQRWWRAAGVPLPTQITQASQQAYLLTWNPKEFPLADLNYRIDEVEQQGSSVFPWRLGNRRSIPKGARVVLMRQVSEPRGLVGVGEVHGDVQEDSGGDRKTKDEGGKSASVDVRWTALSSEPFLDLNRLAQETGDSQIWSSRASGVKLPLAVSQKLEEIWPRAWAERTQNLHATPGIEARRWIARFNSDRDAKGDSLSLDRYIQSFARVMASRNLTPPLSIGLFGDWGSGKTFFMDRLYEEIETLRETETDPSMYWNQICQIRFNAWHYAETNLWASLVSTIFKELRSFLDGRKEDADEFNKLLNELELASALRKGAEKNVKEAAAQHEIARQNVETAERRLRDLPIVQEPSDEKLRQILSKNLKDALAGTDAKTVAKLLDSAAEWSGREEFKEAASRLRSGNDTVQESIAWFEEASALYTRAGFWWRVLSAANLYRTWQFWILIGVLLAIPAIAIKVASRPGIHEEWVHLWALIGEIVTATGAVVGWARSRFTRATAVFDRLSSFESRLARSIEEARTQDRRDYEGRREQALAREKEALAQLEASRRAEQKAAEEERRAREALRDSTSQARLGRFIRERASNVDYEKHLGLIAMIHRDFHRLSELMEKAQNENTDARLFKVDSDSALPRIDRIILYIDDLDRCYPPEKVVKVLEAVHLLLFFPLFVVVVGVDSRWLSRSLHEHYRGMLSDEAMGEDKEAPAGSQDFLEKIFQVPFWLRRMTPDSVQVLVHSLISSYELEASTPVEMHAPPPDGVTAAIEPEPAADRSVAEAPNLGTAGDDPALAAAKRTTGEAEIAKSIIGESLAAPSESLTITEAELAFMDKVCPLMPRTPRSVKRFVNIYRLYKAALSPPALAKFLGTPARPGNYRAVQVLLALVTGSPPLAQQVFRELRNCESGSSKQLSDLVKIAEAGKSWETTVDALKKFAQQQDCDLRLEALKDVSGLVARYSLHNMVIQTPGEAGLG